MNVESRVRATLQWRAHQIEAEPATAPFPMGLEGVHATTTVPLPSDVVQMRPAWRTALAFAAIAACIALVVGALNLWPSTESAAAPLVRGWSRVPAADAGLLDLLGPAGVVSVRDGFVLEAVHYPDPRPTDIGPRFWFSTDGRAWEPISSPAFSDIQIGHTSITGFNGGVVALVNVGNQTLPSLLASSDGHTWARRALNLPLPDTSLAAATNPGPPRISLQRIAEGRGGLFASGFIQVDDQPRGPLNEGGASTTTASRFISAVWRSPDGVSWELIPETVEDDRQILALAASPKSTNVAWASVEMLRGGGTALRMGTSVDFRVLTESGFSRSAPLPTNFSAVSVVMLDDDRTLGAFTTEERTRTVWVNADGSITPDDEIPALLPVKTVDVPGIGPTVIAAGTRSDTHRAPELWVRTSAGWRRADLGVGPEVLGHLALFAAGHGVVLGLTQLQDGGMDVYRWEAPGR